MDGIHVRRWLVIVLLLVNGCAPAGEGKTAAGSGGTHFYFVQVTDTHWGARDGLAMTRSAVAMINRLPVKVEFVAVTGDLFADSIRKEEVVQEGVEVLKGLKVPVHCIPGNHDLPAGDFIRTRAIFEENFGPIQQRLVSKGVICLFLCTESSDDEKRSAWQVARTDIAKMLGAETADPVLIFMHRPPVVDLLGGDDKTPEWGDETDPRWARLFEKYPAIKGVFAGHFHRGEMIWIGNVPVYVAPALARFWDRQPAFRLYEYKDGRLNYWTLYPERPPRK